MKIAEVSEKYGLSGVTLRYYERVGLLPSVTRTESGIREFSEVDIKRVEFIKCMRSAGLPVEVLTEYIAMVQQGDSTVAARKAILSEQRELLKGVCRRCKRRSIAQLQDRHLREQTPRSGTRHFPGEETAKK